MAAHLGIKLINRGDEGELLLKGRLDSVTTEEAAESEAPAAAVSENTGTVRNTIRRHSTGTEAAAFNMFLILFIRMVLIKKQVG